MIIISFGYGRSKYNSLNSTTLPSETSNGAVSGKLYASVYSIPLYLD